MRLPSFRSRRHQGAPRAPPRPPISCAVLPRSISRRESVAPISLNRGFGRIASPLSVCSTPADMKSVGKIAFILWLFPSLLAPSHSPLFGAARIAPPPVRASGASAATLAFAAQKARPRSGVAARATERKLLLLAPQHRVLHRFVDRTTGLVKRNVAAHCGRFRGKGRRHRRPRHFLCRVWVQPRPAASGVAVVCHTTRRHIFRVSVYEPRGPHRSRR